MRENIRVFDFYGYIGDVIDHDLDIGRRLGSSCFGTFLQQPFRPKSIATTTNMSAEQVLTDFKTMLIIHRAPSPIRIGGLRMHALDNLSAGQGGGSRTRGGRSGSSGSGTWPSTTAR
jgi:hypothetical protein